MYEAIPIIAGHLGAIGFFRFFTLISKIVMNTPSYCTKQCMKSPSTFISSGPYNFP